MRRQLVLVLSLLALFEACSRKSDGSKFAATDNELNPPSDPFMDELASTLDSRKNSALPEDQEAAVKKVVSDTDFAERSPLEEAEIAEFVKVLQEAQNAPDPQSQEMLITMQFVGKCVNRAMNDRPMPGWSLSGHWMGTIFCRFLSTGGGGDAVASFEPSAAGRNAPASPTKTEKNVKVEFDFEGANAGAQMMPASPADAQRRENPTPQGGQVTFAVTGKVNGPARVKANGDGFAADDKFRVEFFDRPGFARAYCNGAEKTLNKKVHLVSSTDPTPEHFRNGIKVLGECFRWLLFKASPMGKEALAKMGPLGHLLEARYLGGK